MICIFPLDGDRDRKSQLQYISVCLACQERRIGDGGKEGGSSGWEEVGGMNDANVRELAAACRSKFGWLVRAIP